MRGTCTDCGAPGTWGIFDGAAMLQLCLRCLLGRSQAPAPPCAFGPGWILGHAARTGEVFTHPARTFPQVFHPGCFGPNLYRPVVLGVNHACCRCRDEGRSHAEHHEALIDWGLVLASTRIEALCVVEDLYGLFFLANIPTNAVIEHDGLPPLNVHSAIASGECSGLSIHAHEHRATYANLLPSGLALIDGVVVYEISLMLPPERGAACPGTWAMSAGPDAMTALYSRLNRSALSLLQEA